MIEVSNMSKTFGRHTALADINFKFDEHAVIGLVGNNGAGKTTLINLLMGYQKPSGGSVKMLNGDPVTSLTAAQNTFLVDEKLSYDPLLNLGQIIEKYARYSVNFSKELAYSVLDRFGLKKSRHYLRLSKGMKNQFNIAIGIGANRSITIYDEPVAGLDETSRDKFYAMINEDFIERPKLIIVSSHLLAELQSITNRIMILREGKLIINAETDDLANKFICVTGNCDLLRPLIKDKKIYNEESILNIASVTIDGALTRDEKKYIAENNIEVTSAKVNVVCKIICNSDWEEKHENSTL